MLNNIIIGMCGVNFTLFGCEEKILSNVHIVQCTKKTKTKSAVLPTSLMSFFSTLIADIYIFDKYGYF